VTKQCEAQDSAFAMAGEISAFNADDAHATCVSVTDDVLGLIDETCTVTGGAVTIDAGAGAAFPYRARCGQRPQGARKRIRPPSAWEGAAAAAAR
jgi:predicted RNase H-related nuclease YkuK (DUF458 family)